MSVFMKLLYFKNKQTLSRYIVCEKSVTDIKKTRENKINNIEAFPVDTILKKKPGNEFIF